MFLVAEGKKKNTLMGWPLHESLGHLPSRHKSVSRVVPVDVLSHVIHRLPCHGIHGKTGMSLNTPAHAIRPLPPKETCPPPQTLIRSYVYLCLYSTNAIPSTLNLRRRRKKKRVAISSVTASRTCDRQGSLCTVVHIYRPAACHPPTYHLLPPDQLTQDCPSLIPSSSSPLPPPPLPARVHSATLRYTTNPHPETAHNNRASAIRPLPAYFLLPEDCFTVFVLLARAAFVAELWVLLFTSTCRSRSSTPAAAAAGAGLKRILLQEMCDYTQVRSRIPFSAEPSAFAGGRGSLVQFHLAKTTQWDAGGIFVWSLPLPRPEMVLSLREDTAPLPAQHHHRRAQVSRGGRTYLLFTAGSHCSSDEC